MTTKRHDFAGEAERLGLTEEVYRKKRRSLMACFRVNPEQPTRYKCQGGPFNDAELWLTTSATATIRVCNWLGRYVAPGKTHYFHEERKSYALLTWENM